MLRFLRLFALCLMCTVPLHGIASSLDVENFARPESTGKAVPRAAALAATANFDLHCSSAQPPATQDDHCACPHGGSCSGNCFCVIQSTGLASLPVILSIQRFLPQAADRFENFVPAGLERPPRHI
jgi:hypothetical protein